MGLGGITVGVPNEATARRSASTEARATFGTRCFVPFRSASTTVSPASSSHRSIAVSVPRSTVFGRPLIAFATTFAITPLA